jgi:hypothetical protein
MLSRAKSTRSIPICCPKGKRNARIYTSPISPFAASAESLFAIPAAAFARENVIGIRLGGRPAGQVAILESDIRENVPNLNGHRGNACAQKAQGHGVNYREIHLQIARLFYVIVVE